MEGEQKRQSVDPAMKINSFGGCERDRRRQKAIVRATKLPRKATTLPTKATKLPTKEF